MYVYVYVYVYVWCRCIVSQCRDSTQHTGEGGDCENAISGIGPIDHRNSIPCIAPIV